MAHKKSQDKVQTQDFYQFDHAATKDTKILLQINDMAFVRNSASRFEDDCLYWILVLPLQLTTDSLLLSPRFKGLQSLHNMDHIWRQIPIFSRSVFHQNLAWRCRRIFWFREWNREIPTTLDWHDDDWRLLRFTADSRKWPQFPGQKIQCSFVCRKLDIFRAIVIPVLRQLNSRLV